MLPPNAETGGRANADNELEFESGEASHEYSESDEAEAGNEAEIEGEAEAGNEAQIEGEGGPEIAPAIVE